MKNQLKGETLADEALRNTLQSMVWEGVEDIRDPLLRNGKAVTREEAEQEVKALLDRCEKLFKHERATNPRVELEWERPSDSLLIERAMKPVTARRRLPRDQYGQVAHKSRPNARGRRVIRKNL